MPPKSKSTTKEAQETKKEQDTEESDTELEEAADEEEEWEEDEEEEEQEEEQEDIDIESPKDEEEGGGEDDCVYTSTGKGKNGLNKITSGIDRDDEEDEDIMRNNAGEIVPNDQRITSPNLTKYEMVRIIGDRTMQLTLGAKPMIRNYKGLNPRDIAQLELEARTIPIKIIRPLPDGRREVWHLREMNIRKQFIKMGFDGKIDRKIDEKKVEKKEKVEVLEKPVKKTVKSSKK